MNIKAWLQDIGLIEPAVLIKLDPPEAVNNNVHFVTSELDEFIIKAKKHYCEDCDQFYKDVRGAKAHIRIKHKK